MKKLLFLLFLIPKFVSGQLFEGEVFLPNSSINDISIRNNVIWACENQVIFKYDIVSGIFTQIPDLKYGKSTGQFISIEADEQGQIWIGTDGNGLYRYSPGSIRHYPYGERPLNYSSITCLKSAGNGVVWAGITNGLVKITKDTIVLLEDSPRQITSIYIDGNGNLWCGTEYNGLFHYAQGKWKNFNSQNSHIPQDNITDFCIDKSGRCWYATDKGLIVFADKELKTIVAKYFTGTYISSVVAGSSGEVFVGGAMGLAKIANNIVKIYNTKNRRADVTFLQNLELGIDRTLWCIGENNLKKLAPGEELQTIDRQSNRITSQRLSSVAVDSSGKIWVGSFDKGIFVYDGKQWSNLDTTNSGLPGMDVADITIDSRNNIWINGEENSPKRSWGIAQTDGTKWKVYPERFVHYTIDASGSIWYAKKNMLFRYSTITDSEESIRFPVEQFMINESTLICDKNGEIWISSKYIPEKVTLSAIYDDINPKGTARISDDGIKIYHNEGRPENSLGDFGFSHIFCDGSNNLWAIHDDLSKKIFKLDKSQKPLGWKFVTSIPGRYDGFDFGKFDKKNRLWLGSYQYGLTLWGGKEWTIYNSSNSLLPDDDVRDFDFDKDNNLWVVTRQGVTFLKAPK